MALTWEDKEIRFDIPFYEMRLKLGEKIMDRLDNVEDTKGNSGDRGRLIITNIRLLWHSLTSPRINLSIGFKNIISISTKIVNLKLRGTTQALHLLVNSNSTRFEFIFTNLVPGNMRHFTSVIGVHKAFMSSKLYRDVKLRGAVVHNQQLKILPQEQVFSTVHAVWNLSIDQGSLGTFIVTNVRMVWFADMNEVFNISLPYLQTSSIKIRESKFGLALVITSSKASGSLILGFRVDPEEKLRNLYKELTSLHSIYTANPIFGIEYKWLTKPEYQHNENLMENMDEIVEPKNEMGNTLAVYLADCDHSVDRPPVYDPELGLAVESVKSGFTLKKLWEVLP